MRYVQRGRGVQQGRFLHLCRADPEVKKKESEDGGTGGGGGGAGGGQQIDRYQQLSHR